MSATLCIPDDRLRALMLGELSEDDAGPLEEHLLQCADCVQRTRSLRSADTLVAALQVAGAEELSAAQSSVVEQLVERLCDRSQFSTHSSLLDPTDVPGRQAGRADVSALLAMLAPAETPQELGRLGAFRVLSLLGSGGMGAVLLAEDVQLRRQVALKVLRPDQVRDEEAIERFMREARAAAAVHHDNVVTIYQVGEANGVPFLAQELLDGETLEGRLKRDVQLPITEALRIGWEIAAGLAAAHQRGLLHRDIKPSNIWLEGAAARVKILDFGLARSQQGEEQITHSGMVVGTPACMSPEQAQGLPLDGRSDLFSLGGVLYRMVTGRLPFQGTDTLSMLRALAVDEPAAPQSLNPLVPAELSDFIERLLRKDRDQRPESAETVRQRLADIDARSVGTVAIAAETPRAVKTSRKLVRLALGVVALLGTFIITITHRDGTKTTIETDGGAKIGIEQRPNAAAPKEARTSAVPMPTAPRDADAWRAWPADAPPPAIAPFDANQAKAHQQAWARHLGVPVEYENSIGMRFVFIPPGEFTMGTSALEIARLLEVLPAEKFQLRLPAEGPEHRVRITKPLFLGMHEVTQEQYARVMFANPSSFSEKGEYSLGVASQDTRRFPVDSVSWNNATTFCNRLNAMERLPSRYQMDGSNFRSLDAIGYRLPTEAQWEFACRAGTVESYFFGNDPARLEDFAWLGNNAGGQTHAVGTKSPNPFGLHDLYGNVWEWCEDWFSPVYYSVSATENPQGPELATATRAARGSHWGCDHVVTRTAYRQHHAPTFRDRFSGFRVALTVEAVKHNLATPAAASKADFASVDAPPPAIAPFDARQAEVHQETWARYLGLPVEYENTIGMKFRLIPPGEFLMGTSAAEITRLVEIARAEKHQLRFKTEGPQHRVRITIPLYLGMHEITQEQYARVMATNPSSFSESGEYALGVAGQDTREFPVDSVSWNNATAFCLRLNAMEHLSSRYQMEGANVRIIDAIGYRLPTEAEWEHACRAGTVERHFFGSDPAHLEDYAWIGKNANGQTHAVGTKAPNPFGLHDQYGNVWEWCEDWFSPVYYSVSPVENPQGPESATGTHATRGGDWAADHTYARSAYRSQITPAFRDHFSGFRVALSVEAVKRNLAVPATSNAELTSADALRPANAVAAPSHVPSEVRGRPPDGPQPVNAPP
jgi:formylglycine-generating enzyme required for sulfatase activity